MSGMIQEPTGACVGNEVRLRVWLPGLAALVLCVACGSAGTDAAAAEGGTAGAAEGGSANDKGGSSSSGAAGANDARAGESGNGGTSGNGATGGNGATSGNGATAGNGGAKGGTGGNGGAPAAAAGTGGGVSALPACPVAAPVSAAACAANRQRCFYEDCANVGRTLATCDTGKWSVETGACGTVQCSNPVTLSCQSGQICSVTSGGAILGSCSSNRCGTGAITCACAGSCQSCSINGNLSQGVTVTCAGSCPDASCA